ncbi:MAG: WbqC family protein [Candidatus Omnitrophota bacterium]|nr:WbqC family protein [Candidatus Omnitrophota bacterium]
MKITIHQPEHLPWLGFFHKIAIADVYVILDDVQYRRRYFQNRNRIRTCSGTQYVSVPVVKEPRNSSLIKDVKISRDDPRWKKRNIKSISTAYSKAKYFNHYFDSLQEIYLKDFNFLLDMNLEFIRYLMQALNIKTGFVFSSSLEASGHKGDLILNICKELKAETYISGVSGKDYLNLENFEEAGIKITYQEFYHPVYKQLYEPFVPCMSIIDLLFNYGDKSFSIINGIDVPLMKKVFL